MKAALASRADGPVPGVSGDGIRLFVLALFSGIFQAADKGTQFDSLPADHLASLQNDHRTRGRLEIAFITY